MAHAHNREAEAIIDKEYKLLDRGFIRLVDYMGNDSRIVQAARVSYGSGTKSVRQDKGLIDYLLRNRHTSPFEQVVFTFHCKMPVFVARQWVRHRTARLNEISGRYSIMANEFYMPDDADISLQSSDNKQGRVNEKASDELVARVKAIFSKSYESAYEQYEELVEAGIAREIARINLPLSLYTEWYWQIDLHNLFHFLALRMDQHAQKEIRVYAETMFEIAKLVCPLACESFSEHVLGGVAFSSKEIDAMNAMLEGEKPALTEKEELRLKTKLAEKRQI